MHALSPQTASRRPMQVQALRVQGSQHGVPIPIIYGTNRVAPNFIWIGDFTYQLHEQALGKGAAETTAHVTYTLSMLAALGVGPLTALGSAWAAGNPFQRYDPGDVAATWSLFTGALGQSPWPHLVSDYPGEDLGYTGIGYAAVLGAFLGGASSPPQINFEVTGLLPYDYAGGLVDAEPSAILADLLTQYYGAGVPASMLDTGGTWQQYRTCNLANNFLISPVFNIQQTAAQCVKQILEMTLADCVWSDGMIKLFPYYDEDASGNGANYSPNFAAAAIITDDLVVLGSAGQPQDPIQITRQQPLDRFNEIKIEYVSRDIDYKQMLMTRKSQADVELFTLRPAEVKQFHAITNGGLAQQIGDLLLLRNLTVRNQFQFKLTGNYCWLDPLDLIALNTVETANPDGTARLVRIVSCELSENEEYLITAEDLGVCHAIGYGVQAPASRYAVNGNTAALQLINPPLICEPTAAMTAGLLEMWIALSGALGNVAWGGATIFLSEDGNTYTQIGQLQQAAQMGVTTATLAAYSGGNPDTADTLSLDLTESDGQLESISAAQAARYYNLCAVCNTDGTNLEFLAFETATPTGTNLYNLTTLYRGLFGTAAASHASGSYFAYLGLVSQLDGGIFRYAYPSRLIGKTVYIKATSFDPTGSIDQQLSEATAYSYTVQGTGALGAASSAPGVIANNAWVDLVNVTVELTAGLVISVVGNGGGTVASVTSGDTIDVQIVLNGKTLIQVLGTALANGALTLPAIGDAGAPASSGSYAYQLQARVNSSTASVDLTNANMAATPLYTPSIAGT